MSIWILDADHLSLLHRENSQLIERLSLANQAILLTRNYRDFLQVPNLIIDDWTRADR